MNSPTPVSNPAKPPRRAILSRAGRQSAGAAGQGKTTSEQPLNMYWRHHEQMRLLARDSVAHLAAIQGSTAAIGDRIAELDDDSDAGPGMLSAAAFSLVADVRQIGDWLFDKRQVDARSALEKLCEPTNVEYRDRVVARIAVAGLGEAVKLVVEATDPSAFRALADSPRSPAVYAELQRRASLLLAAEWIIARQLRDQAATDWPPADKPVKTPSGTRSK